MRNCSSWKIARFLFSVLCLSLSFPSVCGAAWGTLSDMHHYHECFELDAKAKPAYKLVMLDSNAAGNVFHPGEQPQVTFQIQNITDRTIQTKGRIDLIRYAQRSYPGDQWYPDLERLEVYDPLPLEVDLPPKGWKNLTVLPNAPETKGGYALIVDLGDLGRAYLTSFVRTFEPDLKRIQFPKQSLEEMPAEILARLGVQAIRWGISYYPSDSRRYKQQWERIEQELQEFHKHKITVVAEVGTGHQGMPLGRGRPHLDENDVMKDGKQDLVWLPEYDDDYQEFVYRIASEYGWPKGPVTGFMLWNEPWEGLSISGWGADMIRYRTLYKRMGDAVFRARREANVDVLVGGCDSSTNTIDKLFPDGSDEFLPYLDFCSIHYQGLSAPVLYPEWNNRTHYKGRVLIWDTESWVANADDCFAAVVAANRAAGYDRSMGTLSRIAVSTLSHNRIAKDDIQTKEGKKTIPRLIESRPLAAAYGAVQHFIGERKFKEILFRNGLPWVFVFHGLNHNPDDGTVVVVGDIGSLFKKGNVLYNTVEPLPDVKPHLILEAEDRPFRMHDVYGNPKDAVNGSIRIPLKSKGYFLRADPDVSGSFDALIQALRNARVVGLEPVEMIPYDMTRPMSQNPVMRLRATNMHNEPISGRLEVKVQGLQTEYPATLSLKARERRWIDIQLRGEARPDNTYPTELTFDAGDHGISIHKEEMHVNWISHKTIDVDGNLNDWSGAIPQTIQTEEAAKQSFEESMWLPFAEWKEGRTGGLAVAYLAWDDKNFYFAAKIADETEHHGTPRFETRDENADFYPKVSYEMKDGKKIEHVWPDGVRHFSYRRWPHVPTGMPQNSFDNVLIGFNAIPMVEDEWETHLPGRMPKFIWYKTTDYEYALNNVAKSYGDGTEIWRAMVPGMPYKHFYPRQPKHPLEGPVKDGQLAFRYDSGVRIVECALPWNEIPHVKKLLDQGDTVKFSFHVNHESRGPDMELSMNRSAAEGISSAFHPNWSRSWPNELQFGFER